MTRKMRGMGVASCWGLFRLSWPLTGQIGRKRGNWLKSICPLIWRKNVCLMAGAIRFVLSRLFLPHWSSLCAFSVTFLVGNANFAIHRVTKSIRKHKTNGMRLMLRNCPWAKIGWIRSMNRPNSTWRVGFDGRGFGPIFYIISKLELY